MFVFAEVIWSNSQTYHLHLCKKTQSHKGFLVQICGHLEQQLANMRQLWNVITLPQTSGLMLKAPKWDDDKYLTSITAELLTGQFFIRNSDAAPGRASEGLQAPPGRAQRHAGPASCSGLRAAARPHRGQPTKANRTRRGAGRARNRWPPARTPGLTRSAARRLYGRCAKKSNRWLRGAMDSALDF